MKKKVIYLAGPIAGMSDGGCKAWRDWLISFDDSVEWLNPMDRDYRGARDIPPAMVVEPDKADILRSDAVIAVVEPVSVGTSMEILFAWGYRIPVIAVARRDVSPWIRYHASCVTDNLRDALIMAKSAARRR